MTKAERLQLIIDTHKRLIKEKKEIENNES